MKCKGKNKNGEGCNRTLVRKDYCHDHIKQKKEELEIDIKCNEDFNQIVSNESETLIGEKKNEEAKKVFAMNSENYGNEESDNNEGKQIISENNENQNEEKPLIEKTKQSEIKKVGTSVRFIHFIIDSVVWLFFSFILMHIFTARMTGKDGYIIIYLIIFVILFLTFVAYYLIMEALCQKTVAKFLTKTKVASTNGDKPKITAILKRTFCRLIPFADQISFLFTRKGLHDKLSDTVVIKNDFSKLNKNKSEKKESVKSSMRFINFTIDSVVWISIAFILASSLNLNERIQDVITLGTFIGYYYIMEVYCQRTIAKFITKTKVITNDGNKPKKISILIRTICRLTPFVDQISYLIKRNGFHDRLSKTMVIKSSYCNFQENQNEEKQRWSEKDKEINKEIKKQWKEEESRHFLSIVLTLLSIVIALIGNYWVPQFIEENSTNRYFIGVLLKESKNESARIRGASILKENKVISTVKLSNEIQIEQISNDECGVIINDVRWATRNVGEIGKFVSKPEDAGIHYQWNRLKVQRRFLGLTGNRGYAIGSSWERNYDPSPGGWRVPSIQEIEKLLDEYKVSNEWTYVNGVEGRKFTDKTNGNTIFLPAVGGNNPSIGTYSLTGMSGHYWSSTANGQYYAQELFFHSGNVFKSISHRGNSFSIRSVSQNPVPAHKRTYKPDLYILSMEVKNTLYQHQAVSFTATVKNDGNDAYKSKLWFYLEKPDTNIWQRFGTGDIFLIAPGETKTIIINHVITLPPDTYNCNMVFDVNNNPSNMATYQFNNTKNPLGIQVMVLTPTAPLKDKYEDEGVIIDGVKWATRNVDAPGTFADAPESAGMFYQRNIKVGWSITDPKKNTDSNAVWIYSSEGKMASTWDSDNDPCPDGFRLPTMSELKSLVNSGSQWTKINNVNGRLFGKGKNQIFLPASGSRDERNGTLGNFGSIGFIWSSDYGIGEGYYLRFNSYEVGTAGSNSAVIWAYGFPCRCVSK